MEKLAYPVNEAAAMIGISPSKLRQHIARNDLTARYVGNKPLIPHDELKAWLESLPTENTKAA